MADPAMAGAQARSDLTPERLVDQIASELAHHMAGFEVTDDEFGPVQLRHALLERGMTKEQSEEFLRRVSKEAARMAIYYRDHPVRGTHRKET